jgi:hypothetical protein
MILLTDGLLYTNITKDFIPAFADVQIYVE